ncbi:hypothetical protein BDV98DRAFT_207974 [Pterulicium gracile]|uniref:Fungal-type protein kinase domain-containing protein n=1 Tax=Pterulicium gracile TaxID=1884261 RepID=A0A5C3QC05_9AGAR|nr:hypothetical protein BDV98DRAFT_207974 [Pterula gracilis]
MQLPKKNDQDRDSALRKMGLDTTLTPVLNPDVNAVKDDDGNPQYRFRMKSIDDEHDYEWETIKVLSNLKAKDFLSRSTRVWLVRRIDRPKDIDGNEILWVMKECYAEDDVDTEGAIWCDLRRRVEKEGPDIDREAQKGWNQQEPYVSLIDRFKRHFLQLEAHKNLNPASDVPRARLWPKDVIEAGQVLNILRPNLIAPEDYSKKYSQSSSSQQSREDSACRGMTGSGSHDSLPVKLALSAPRRKQRTLWKDANDVVPLEDLDDIQDMHTALVDTCHALEVLYELGLVHRDVSSGNIYYDRRTKTGRLGDFEFVKKYGVSQGEDTKRGTPLFWSPEVEKSKYIITRTDETHAFAHHYLHDGESIYWILKYILCSYAPKFLEGVTRKGLDDITSAQRKDLFRLYIPST